eukprot:698837-Rhodomonas_salina.3
MWRSSKGPGPDIYTPPDQYPNSGSTWGLSKGLQPDTLSNHSGDDNANDNSTDYGSDSSQTDDGDEEDTNPENPAQYEMLDSFYNQTVGAMFTWTIECVLLALTVWILYMTLEALVLGDSKPGLITKWSTLSVFVNTLVMAGTNALIAFSNWFPGIFKRHYMMCTQAYCGIVSVTGTIFSAVAWKTMNSEAWRDIFMQNNGTRLHIMLITVTACNNVQWLLSLILTYSCTPFGQSNVAFFHIPVAAALILFVILVNETATNGLILCNDQNQNIMAVAVTNAGIISSFVIYILGAVEFDPLQKFPDFMHSSVDTNIRFDVYALIHGIGLLFVILAYGTMAKLSATTFT